MESATSAQGRALELARQMFDELSESRNEGRDAFERIVKAQRAAGEAAVEAARSVAGTTAERVRTGVSRVTARGEKAAEAAAPAVTGRRGWFGIMAGRAGIPRLIQGRPRCAKARSRLAWASSLGSSC